METLVSQLVEKDLACGRINLSGAYCCDCGLRIPVGTPHLANALCRSQVAEQKDAILADFGIA
jgi:hypothetical protein